MKININTQVRFSHRYGKKNKNARVVKHQIGSTRRHETEKKDIVISTRINTYHKKKNNKKKQTDYDAATIWDAVSVQDKLLMHTVCGWKAESSPTPFWKRQFFFQTKTHSCGLLVCARRDRLNGPEVAIQTAVC